MCAFNTVVALTLIFGYSHAALLNCLVHFSIVAWKSGGTVRVWAVYNIYALKSLQQVISTLFVRDVP
jgi:hypothetical protein